MYEHNSSRLRLASVSQRKSQSTGVPDRPITESQTAMESKIHLSLTGVFLLCGTILANDAPGDHIDVLIRGLDAGTLAERSRAERQILDLGPEVLSKIPVLETIESVSARESLRRIRLQLERRAAKESSGPSKVTLQGSFGLVETLRKIQQQTGNRIELAADQAELRGLTLVLDWDKTNFWNCLDDLRRRYSLEWDSPRNSTSMPIFRKKVATNPRAVQISGPFRVSIENVEFRDVVGESQQKLLRVTTRLSVEPRLRPLSISMAASELKAALNNGQPIAPWNPDAKYEHPVRDDNHEVVMTWDFVQSNALTESGISIRGTLHCQIAAAVERVVFDRTSLTSGTIRRRGGVSVRLREVTFGDDDSETHDAEIGITVSYEAGGPAFESHRTWIYHNAVYLETKSGVRSNFTGFETAQQSDGTVAVDYRWRNLASPGNQFQFVYEAPTLIIDVPIEIDFGEITLDR